MKDCEKAAHILAYAVVYFHGLRMVRESYYGITTMNGFPGTENELQRFLEAMRCIEDVGGRLHDAALEHMEEFE